MLLQSRHRQQGGPVNRQDFQAMNLADPAQIVQRPFATWKRSTRLLKLEVSHRDCICLYHGSSCDEQIDGWNSGVAPSTDEGSDLAKGGSALGLLLRR